ncbi:MAG: hypothetical protein CFE32_07130 [Alphaproteobacteria bacterium PA3]|nr:MAG: hypothetical protein CFE32_07130 [Alphaproteobacteria bacterium PA3]
MAPDQAPAIRVGFQGNDLRAACYFKLTPSDSCSPNKLSQISLLKDDGSGKSFQVLPIFAEIII